VLIGTPGRLIDYFKQGVFALTGVQVVVLDEADRMFDLGFIRDIRFVLRRLPPAEQRLNLLFSATLGHRVLELAYEHMNEPELVRIEPDKITVDSVTQKVYFPANEDKPKLLIGLLRSMGATRTMVFVNTKREAEFLERLLRANDVSASAISGDVPQRKRLSMLRDFQSGDLPVLVATDVASRGLHVPDVSHVINYDLPQDAEDYVHRIGRTARAGATGDAISFACENFAFTLPDIEDFIGHRIPVEAVQASALPKIVSPPPAPRRTGGRHGKDKNASRTQRGNGKTGRPRRRRRSKPQSD
jgi:ATP-dependent RNA helicase RhlB